MALEAATVFFNAAIVLASATKALLFHFDLKRIWALMQDLLNRSLPVTFTVVFRIVASDTSANSWATGQISLETRAVQLEAARTDAVASYFTRRKLQQRVAFTGRAKSPRVPSKDGSDRLGACPVYATFGNRIFALQAAALCLVASTTSFEAVTIQGYTLAFWARATRRIVMKFPNLKCGGTQEVEFVESLGLLEQGRHLLLLMR